MIVLFLNHKIQSCGVYQYGVRVFNILQKSYTPVYVYKEIENYTEYVDITNKIKPKIIIYNYHGATMSWLNNNTILIMYNTFKILREGKAIVVAF